MPGALQQSQEREALQQRRIEELERESSIHVQSVICTEPVFLVLSPGELQTARAAAEAGGGARNSTSPEPPQPDLTPADLLNNHVLLSLAEWASAAADGSISRPKGTITSSGSLAL